MIVSAKASNKYVACVSGTIPEYSSEEDESNLATSEHFRVSAMETCQIIKSLSAVPWWISDAWKSLMLARNGRHVARSKIETNIVLAINNRCSFTLQLLVCTQQGITKIR